MSDQKEGFTQKQVAKLLGINYNSVALYAKTRLIIPEITNPRGRGTTRVYSKKNLFEFLLLKELSKHGLTHKQIKKVILELKEETFSKKAKPEAEEFTAEKRTIKTGLLPYMYVKKMYMKDETKPWSDVLFEPDPKKNPERQYLFIANTHTNKMMVLLFGIPSLTTRTHSEMIHFPMGYKGYRVDSLLVIDVTSLVERIQRI